MESMIIIGLSFLIFSSNIDGLIGSHTVLKVPSVKEATFSEKLSSSLPDTEYHECSVTERGLEICERVTQENEYCHLHGCKFIEGKTMDKKKKFHVQQVGRRGSKDVVLNLCKCPTKPAIFIQDNVYSNDVTVFLDMASS